MTTPSKLQASQRIVQVCLFLVAAIAISGGTLQMYLGEPDTTARLDNIHRFMAGVYLACGIIGLWAGVTIRQQGTLIYLLALAIFMGAVGRLVSISIVGLPEPSAVWIAYLTPELVIPVIMVLAHQRSTKN
jgi:hypothetical protein